MTEYEKKAAFVEKQLAALLRKIDKTIGVVEYEHGICGVEEFVTVYEIAICQNGGTFELVKGKKMFRACVTGDSLPALTVDVLKAGGYYD
jgi:hypothetical protein